MGRKPLVRSSYASHKEVLFINSSYLRYKDLLRFSKDEEMKELSYKFVTKVDNILSSFDGKFRRIMNFVLNRETDPELSSSHFYRLRAIAVNTFLERFYEA